MQAARKEHTASGLAQSLRHFGQGSIPDLWPKLETLQCPVLLITGDKDHKYTTIAEKMLPLLPYGLHHRIQNAGHMAHIEALDAASEKIRIFLRKITLSEHSE